MSFNDWLPSGVAEIKDLKPLNGQIDAGTRKTNVKEWKSQKRSFAVEAGNETQARIRSYYYPLWKAYIINNGQKSQTTTAKAEDGTLLIALTTEAVEVEVIFEEPAYIKFSLIIAFIGWTSALALLIICSFIKFKDINKQN